MFLNNVSYTHAADEKGRNAMRNEKKDILKKSLRIINSVLCLSPRSNGHCSSDTVSYSTTVFRNQQARRVRLANIPRPLSIILQTQSSGIDNYRVSVQINKTKLGDHAIKFPAVIDRKRNPVSWPTSRDQIVGKVLIPANF